MGNLETFLYCATGIFIGHCLARFFWYLSRPKKVKPKQCDPYKHYCVLLMVKHNDTEEDSLTIFGPFDTHKEALKYRKLLGSSTISAHEIICKVQNMSEAI